VCLNLQAAVRPMAAPPMLLRQYEVIELF